MTTAEKIASVTEDIAAEVSRAMSIHQSMHGPHEGYAVILEELDELWDLVKGYPKRAALESMREEAIQVAAMAARFVIDVCPWPTGRPLPEVKP